MDHRITVWLIALVGGTIAFTVFLGMIASSLGPPGPADAQAQVQMSGDPREDLARVVARLDARLSQWRADHGGAEPDFVSYAGWEQFLRHTNYRGIPVDAPSPATRAATTRPATGPATRPSDLDAAVGRTYGPYLAVTPVNPLNHMTGVACVPGPVRAGFRLQERTGFVYSRADGRFFGTNAIGRGISNPRPAGAPGGQQ